MSTEETHDYRKLSVIVPVFDERNTVVEIVRRMRAVDLPVDLEIVIVDDGSTDGTRDVLRQLGDSTVRVITHEANRGKGAAIRSGLAHVHRRPRAGAGRRPRVRPRGLAEAARADPQGQGARRLRLALHRRAAQHAVPALGRQPVPVAVTNVLYNTTLSDMETCYKLFDRERARQHHAARATRFEFEPEVTAKILRRGIRIYEVPISYTGREFDEGKKITWRDGFIALWTLVKYRFVDLSRDRPAPAGPRWW